MKSSTRLGPCSARCLRWMWMTAICLGLSNCVSHRYVVSQPDRVIGNWDLVDTTPPGTGIDVLLEGGETASGTYRSSTENEITIADQAGLETSVAKPQVQEIRATGADGLASGAFIGLGLGAVGGAITQVEGDKEAFWSTLGWSIGLGILIDALIAQHEILYQAQ